MNFKETSQNEFTPFVLVEKQVRMKHTVMHEKMCWTKFVGQNSALLIRACDPCHKACEGSGKCQSPGHSHGPWLAQIADEKNHSLFEGSIAHI